MIKAIIFDLDGVLLSTDKFHYKAWKNLADRENIYFDESINNRLRGVSRMDSLNIILEKSNKKYTNEEKNEMTEYKNNMYKTFLQELSPRDLDEKTINTLNTLKNMNFKLIIGSSSKNTKYILSLVSIIDYFDYIVDGNMIKNSKPHPEVFLMGRDFFHFSSSECIVVEDATSGIDAAKAGGFTAIGIKDAAKYSKTDYPIDSLEEIIEIVKNLNK